MDVPNRRRARPRRHGGPAPPAQLGLGACRALHGRPIARSYLTPKAQARIEAILAADPDTLTGRSMAEWGREVGGFTAFPGIFNGTGQPSMSLPLAMSKDGLPMGVMVTGRYGEEALLFRLAGQLEKAAPWNARRPKLG